MKSYTSIDQSKKLAEILPIESADMCWCNRCWCNSSPKGVDYIDKYAIHAHTLSEMKEAFDEVFTGWDKYWELIPAWSLAALLDVYPMIVGRDLDMYCCWQNHKNLHSRHYDNPVDACYEMIIKLHELKML